MLGSIWDTELGNQVEPQALVTLDNKKILDKTIIYLTKQSTKLQRKTLKTTTAYLTMLQWSRTSFNQP